jgi:hypothetical protein
VNATKPPLPATSPAESTISGNLTVFLAAIRADENMDWVADAPFTDEEITGLYGFLLEATGH